MTEYLVFRLYAPLASWGEAAVGESRPSATYPGRGAIIGLLGAALGVRRDDDERQRQLRESVCIAVKQRSPGALLRDYHTVQVPAAQSKVTYHTRRDELNAPRKVINTILSSRDYRGDGLWTVAVWLTSQAKLTLSEMEQALKTPYFPLYLGRKACPPAAPLAPRREICGCLLDALDTSFPPLCGTADEERRVLNLPDETLYAWEGDPKHLDGSLEGNESNDVWDEPLHRRRWQFGPRAEFRRIVGQEEGR
ncbi:type I-E CRISPR-associated protein Cas5/CasD [Aidingimonas lacisalsi]|uniref:type I-E CRISPR-associated protein Cas5/CasD n=1 Tax=Aidingimonas lacisalsi TaxID=2604086 RepID=UPI0011D1E50A|nr:type I-E CRISPR-associated protein Cas5/CasD [Aidingimonas lacisalsi]